MRSKWVALLLALSASQGCAARRPAAPPVVATPAPPAVDVTALIGQGCFHCLERALEAATGEQAFEVAGLLTLRAKELGLPSAPYRDRAGALVPTGQAWAVYLEIIDAVAADRLSGARYVETVAVPAGPAAGTPGISPPMRILRPPDRTGEWHELLQTGPGSDLFRQYLDMTIACTLANPPRESAESSVSRVSDAPLLMYRAATCRGESAGLQALREREPDFADVDFHLGRLALGRAPVDLDEALRYLESARAAFPTSLAIGTAYGSVREQREEWLDALGAYDSVLASMPEHRDALLGRMTALSRLRRHEEAIETATRMIDLGTWFMGEAFYWRAWNHFSVQRYTDARADADRARARMVNAAVFVLSGLIEWNERRLPSAETELEEALKMDFGRCDAAQYLGRVRVQRGKRPEARAAFRQAIQCFDLSITVRRKLVADVQAGPGSDASKARLTAGHERAMADAIRDRDECLQNLAAIETAERP